MAAQRDIERLMEKYRLHREARAGHPLVVDERTRERLMSVVEDQYGSAGFVSSQEAAEKYAESLAWQKGLERWWHRMVPWIGFAGVCCLALIVIFVAVNHNQDAKQALVKGSDLMESVEPAPAAAPASTPAPAPKQPPLKNAQVTADNDSAGAIAPTAQFEAAKSAPRPLPKPPARPIVIQAPLPDPSAPIAELRSERPAPSTATMARSAGGRSAVPAPLDENTEPASELVPITSARSPARMSRARKPAAEVADSTRPPPEAATVQVLSAPVAKSARVMAPASAAPAGPAPGRATQRAGQTEALTPVPPPTPIVWDSPRSDAAAGRQAAQANQAAPSKPVSAPASTPRMQRFRSTGPVLHRRRADISTGFVIMGQFDLLTAGSRVTVKDADGSIYNGRVTSAQAATFAFRVAGANRTSGQKVEFSGRYAPVVSGPDAGRQRLTGAGLEGEIKVGDGPPGRLTARRIR